MATNGTARFPDKQGNNRRVGYGSPPLETRFRPGQSGNPAGRPRRKTLGECIAALLDETDLYGKPIPGGRSVADLLALTIVKEALEGKFPFAKEILDRTEGKVPDRVAWTEGRPPMDLSVLSDEDLDALGRIMMKLGSVGPPADM